MNNEAERPSGDGPVEEPEWATHCEHCGTELESGVVDLAPGPESEHRQTAPPATVVAQDFCPNPECPAKVSVPEPGAS